MRACPVFLQPFYKPLLERYGREAAVGLALLFETPGFQEWYGGDEIIFDSNFTLYGANGSPLAIDLLVQELKGSDRVSSEIAKKVRVKDVNFIPQSEVRPEVMRLLEPVMKGNKIDIKALKKVMLETLGKGNINRFTLTALSLMENSPVMANLDLKFGATDKKDALGVYSRASDSIILIPDNFKTVESVYTTLVHELVHAYTLTPFNKLQNALGVPDVNITLDMFHDARNEGRLGNITAKEERFLIEVLTSFTNMKKAFPESTHYGTESPSEFVAELMSNKRFAEFVEYNQPSIFKRVLQAILSLFDLSSKNIDDLAMFIFEQIEEEAQGTRTRLAANSAGAIEMIKYKLADTEAFSGVRLTLDENNYTDREGNLYERLTSWVRAKFSPNPITFDELIEKRAKVDFEKQGKPLTDKIEVTKDGVVQAFSFDEWVAFKKINQATQAVKGTIIHLMIEKKIRQLMGENVEDLDSRIRELAEAKEGQNAISLRSLNWITEEGRIARIFDRLGLNFGSTVIPVDEKDKLEAEVPAISKLLGIGTTIDMVVQHANKDYSLFDWKSGEGFFNNELTSVMMKYSTGYIDVPDSSVSKAKLELALRALMIKEADPSARFRDLAVVHLEKYQDARIIPADLQTFLPIIEAYVKNEKPESYAEMKNRGLFSPDSYLGQSASRAELEDRGRDVKDLEELEIMDVTMQEDVMRLSNKDSRKKQVLKATESLIEKTLGKRAEYDDKDITPITRWIGNAYSIGNELVQGFIAYFQKAQLAAKKELAELFEKEDKFFKAVQDEYYAKHPGKKFADEYSFFGGTNYHTEDNAGVFDFMWEMKDSTQVDTAGAYMRTITEDDVRAGRFTQAQYDYNKFQRETMASYYSETMVKPKFGGVSRADLEGVPSSLPAGFAPRLYATPGEIRARYGLLSKESFKQMYKRSMSSFLESERYSTTRKASIPLKYLGSSQLIESGNHTFNSQASYRMFMTNLIMKKYLDPAQALGQGVRAVLDYQGEKSHADPEHYKQTKDFVKSFIEMHIENADNPQELVRKTVTIFGKKVNLPAALDILRRWVSSTSMWLNLPGGAFNMILINMLNIKRAIEGSIGNSDITGFGMSDLIFGYKQWLQWSKDGMLKRNNKLEKIAEKINFMPNNYDYAAHSSKMLSSKYKFWDKSKLYAFHSIGEDMGQLTVLAAMLNHMKHPKTKKSLWECFDENGNWRPEVPARGVTANGVLITDLTSEEVTAMKRTSAKLHGGYRHEERVALETGALGRWLLLFKKYLPSILELNFKSYYKDRSSGYWEERVAVSEDGLFDKNGNPVFKVLEDGTKETIYDWRSRVQEGRIRLMFKFLGTVLNIYNNPEYRRDRLKPEQKQELISLATTGAFLAGILLLMQGFDDDDKDKPIYFRINKLAEDITQGLNPVDLLKSLENSQLVVSKLLDLITGTFTFLVDGLVRGERTRDGRVPGEVNLIKSIPILNSLYGVDQFLETDVYIDAR